MTESQPAELHDVAVGLVTTSARISRLAAALAPESGPRAITRALSLLDEYGAMRISDFAHIDRCSQPSATALVSKLIQQGFATRRRDPNDSRAVVVEITSAGHEQLTRSREAIGKALTPRLSQIDPDLITRLHQDLAELYQALKEQNPQAHSRKAS
ncbi:MarR family winged helix-turn-helix transcriptional regulator [Skermania sp. ID1734]|uniref:MarR family winged helix-turn-helix transcriptional regulator n=1 Tax=Skermania sp. ID1734 TaxID=2597516 RepID=UPI0021059433|nr:MarR family transcriptional regulator [Skermania sp. ID1734]